MYGLEVYKTKDGFTVARLHYSADLMKVLPNGEPVPELIDGYIGGRSGPAWRKEMEIDFTAYSGQLLCYHILNKYRDKIVVDCYVKESDYKYGSLDWGRNNPASFHVYALNEDNHIHSAYEIYQNDTSIPDFFSFIKQCPYYQSLQWISADPSIWNRNQEDLQDLLSFYDKFFHEGVILQRGKSRDDTIAINELLDRWSHLDVQNPTFTISPRCHRQIWEFERLRYQEITTAMIELRNQNETLVDKDNHSWDDFKYFISKLLFVPALEIHEDISPISPLYKMQELRRKREEAR